MIYNIVKDYDWTSVPKGTEIRDKAPSVWVKSYKLKSNQIMHAIQGFINITGEVGGDAKAFYDAMYAKASKPEDDFNFPFLSDNVRSFDNTFGDTFQDGIGGSGGIAGGLYEAAKGLVGGLAQAKNITSEDAVSKAFKQVSDQDYSGAAKTIGQGGNPGTYVETPMFYQFDKSDSPLEVSFVLYNTINADSILKNKSLIYRLTEINRPLRKDSIAVDPPRIYQVKVPGHRFIRWAYCNNFSINMMGTRRIIDNVIVPEAYQITMSFKSLTLEHAGFLKQI